MRAFSALIEKDAAAISRTAAEAGSKAFKFHGMWLGRKFLLRTITAQNQPPITSVTKDFDTETITLTKEALSNPKIVLSALRSFGAAAARLRQRKVSFEIVEGFDRALHIVPGHHHVALCGHRGPWPDNVHEGISATCAACSKIAVTKPAHRARFHPLSAGNSEG